MLDRNEKLRVLSKIAESLNQQAVVWGIGGSLLLFIKGVVEDFHDIDILISEQDVDKARDILLSFGTQLPENPDAQYNTKCFMEFNVDGVDIDMIAGFTIVSEGKVYYLPIENQPISDYWEINGVRIPLQSIELWRYYYQLMGRTDKVEIIDRFGHDEIDKR